MTILGFDVAKDQLIGVRIDRSTTIKERFVLGNNAQAIDELTNALLATKRQVLVACEATAEYHVLLAKACVTQGIPFRLVNPILTKQFTRATVRRKKTDLTDAHVIAKLALQGEGTAIGADDFSPLKAITRTSVKLTHLAQILELISQRYANHWAHEVGLAEEVQRCQAVLRTAITVFRQRAQQTLDPVTTHLLQSIAGIGPTLALHLIAEIGTITRFPSGKALVAYAGLDPRVKQSGISLHHNSRLTKRGSATLRRTLFVAASIAQRHDQELKDYYAKKRQEGKRYKEATVAVARKLCYRIYAVWKRGTPYQKRLASPMGT